MNQMSLLVIRLLQTFDHIELALDAQPLGAWSAGRGNKAGLVPKSEFTMHVPVSVAFMDHDAMYADVCLCRAGYGCGSERRMRTCKVHLLRIQGWICTVRDFRHTYMLTSSS